MPTDRPIPRRRLSRGRVWAVLGLVLGGAVLFGGYLGAQRLARSGPFPSEVVLAFSAHTRTDFLPCG